MKNTALVYSQAFAYLQAAFPSQEDELEHERLPAGRPHGTQWLRQAMQETAIKWGFDWKSGRKARNLSRIKMVKQSYRLHYHNLGLRLQLTPKGCAVARLGNEYRILN